MNVQTFAGKWKEKKRKETFFYIYIYIECHSLYLCINWKKKKRDRFSVRDLLTGN
jgi:hypothetical protein